MPGFTINSHIKLFNTDLNDLPIQKLLINTINAYSYTLAQNDLEFAKALNESDILLPDGISIVIAQYFLTGKKIKKIAGSDLFYFELNRLNIIGGKCFFLGSNENTLNSIVKHLKLDYPKIELQIYSPPFKKEFSVEDNKSMLEAINKFRPDVLFVGMTAPKQEKWAYAHFNELVVGHICCIGAVFDFYAGTIKRAPIWMIRSGFEWLYRLLKEPRRMWKRYLIGNSRFIWHVLKEKFYIS